MQVFPAATVEPFVHVVPVAIAKSAGFAPPSATVVMCNTSVPPLVSVTVSGTLVVPCIWLAKGSGLGVGVACGNTPVPVTPAVCGLPEALSATVIVALLPPSAVGVNVTAIVQLPAAANVPTVRQSVPLAGATSAKSPGFVPINVTLVIVSVPVPEFVSTVVIGPLATPCRWFPNATGDGLKFTVDVTPVPVRFTTCVVGLASSVNVTVAASAPNPVGVNVTFTTQLLPAFTVPPFVHVVVPPTIANAPGFVPPSATVVMCSTSVPPLASVIVCGPLVIPFVWLPNGTVPGAALACGNTPVPVTFTTCVVGLASSVNVIVAACPPSPVGVNVTFTTQFPPAATVDPFVHVVPVPTIANWFAFVPPNATVVRCSVSVPPLFNVSVCVPLVVFCRWFPNANGLGVGVACGNTPVPVTFTTCVVGLASSVNVIVAACPPSPVGVNVTFTTQFPPASTVDPFVHVVPVPTIANWFAFVPPNATVARFNVPVPPFVSVSVCTALVVFCRWFPNANGLGVGVACGNTPVPVTPAVCGLPEALSATVIVALLPPNAVGVNVTAIVQLPAAANVPTVRQSVPLAGATSAKSPGFVPINVTLVIVSVPVPEFVSTVVIGPLATPCRWFPNATGDGLKSPSTSPQSPSGSPPASSDWRHP